MKNLFTFSGFFRKQLRFASITLLFCFTVLTAYPQLKIVSSGNVGIDTSSPASRFSIGDAGVANSKVFILGSNTSGDQKGPEVNQAAIKEQQAEIEELKKQLNR
ncbi:MAG: hypothetical protein PHI28_12485 [Mangrovibacterium sp.]|nr:hypothetical protein [Mangrovibacterium sp.]